MGQYLSDPGTNNYVIETQVTRESERSSTDATDAKRNQQEDAAKAMSGR